jgi:hypothetical protein
MEDGIFLTIWSIFRLFGIFYGHLVYFVVIWYILTRFGMLYQEPRIIWQPCLALILCASSIYAIKKRLTNSGEFFFLMSKNIHLDNELQPFENAVRI